MPDAEIGELQPGELDAAVGVLARGMRDNPIHIAVAGPDPERRVRFLGRVFRSLLTVRKEFPVICARRDGEVVGVVALTPAGRCKLSVGDTLRIFPAGLTLGPRVGRLLSWTGAWEKLDPAESHSHLGPVAVDAHLQHQGIGSAMMQAYADRMDRDGTLAYLETDKPENVVFYRRFGFEVTHEQDVIGVPNWFMQRPAPH